MDPDCTKQKVADLLAGGLKGMGERKLSALEKPLLVELVLAVGGEADESEETASLVKKLLKKKKAKEIREPINSVAHCEAESEANETHQCPKEDPRTSKLHIFKHKHKITFIAFNALKLRLDNEVLADDFKELAAAFSEADVISISEVAAGTQRTISRAMQFKSMLEASGASWNMAMSDPSGPGNPEVHLILAKAPVRIVRWVTTSTAGGVPLDHAPITALLEDARFGLFSQFVLTSVHFPPESRAKSRDAQIASFFKSYATQAALRCDTPFAEAGAKDARRKLPVHIVAGDFNTWPGHKRFSLGAERYDVALGEHISTTSGNKCFDNFVLSEHARNYFALSHRVMEFQTPQNSHKGVVGLSDHSPIMLSLER
jgi:endonuclease/exonuclease/phosphatase family metal-dependent hydrolase